MADLDSGWISLIGLGLAVIAIILVVSNGSNDIVVQQGDAQNTVLATGQAEMFFSPDNVDVYVRIETDDDEAQPTQEENKIISDNVVKALGLMKVKEIQTIEYRLEKVKEWNRKDEVTVDKGYRLIHVIKVTDGDVDRTGEIMDAVVQAGANGIDRIEFGLSDDKQFDAKETVLSMAAEDAKKKADAIADGLDVNLGKPVQVKEINYVFAPFRSQMAESLAVQQVGIEASVEVEYLIK